MIIIIQSTGDILDIPSNVSLNIELSSPIFGDMASGTLPLTLPSSDTNRKALSFPDRLDIYQDGEFRQIQDTIVIVKQGSFQQTGRLSISSYSEEGIECVIDFSESNFLTKLEDITLPQVMAGLIFGNVPPQGANLTPYRNQLVETLYQDYEYEASGSFYRGEGAIEFWLTKQNDKATWLEGKDFIISPVSTEKDGWLNEAQNYLYTSPFLRLDYVLHRIFEYIGTELSIDLDSLNDCIKVKGEQLWKSIVVLNNTMDALYPGCIYYSSLVPDISCKDFLRAVKSQFGVSFILNNDFSVRMVFNKYILNNYTANNLEYYRNKQIAFNTPLEYSPDEGLSSIDKPGENGIYLELEGVCQRTTYSKIENEDATRDTKCPLTFAVYDVYFIPPHDQHDDYYTARMVLIDSIPYFHTNHPNDIRDLSYHPLNYCGNNTVTFYDYTNNEMLQIIDSIETVTISKTITIDELRKFDFCVPYVLNGRLCWPVKLQYTLENALKQNISLELIAPRKIV